MFIRLFVAFIVIVAVIVGIMTMIMPREEIVRLIMFRDFFDVSIPILGFGALVKYLCSCTGMNKCCSCCDKACGNNECRK